MADQKISQLPPGAATATSILPVVNGTTTQRVTVKQIVDLATANVPAGTIDTTGNTTGVTEGAALPIDQVLREVIDKAAFNQYGASHSILTVSSPDWAPGSWGGDGTIQAGGVAAGEMLTGTLYYGALIDLNSRAVVSEGYQLPLPTQQGYLRADQDPASGWYFAEPVIVSDTEPPTPPGDPSLPVIWIDPTGTPPEYIYGVTVFEQDAEPAAGKDGDLWLSTAASVAAGATTGDGSRITMQDVDREIENALTDPSSAVLRELKDAIVAAALSRINGYTSKTPDCEWQETTVAAGSGKVEASIRGGVLRLRGTVTLTTSKSTHFRTLPIGFPRPATGSATVCVAAESGVAERLVIVFINPDGKIEMSPMGNRVTDFRVDSATCQMP
jgi:hypothetical protein